MVHGAIGYMFQKALRNELRRLRIDKPTVTVVTQLLLDKGDPALARPTKPIGSHMDEPSRKSLSRGVGWCAETRSHGFGRRRFRQAAGCVSVCEIGRHGRR